MKTPDSIHTAWPSAVVVEVDGNPNIMGQYLWSVTVNGVRGAAYTDGQGEIESWSDNLPDPSGGFKVAICVRCGDPVTEDIPAETVQEVATGYVCRACGRLVEAERQQNAPSAA